MARVFFGDSAKVSCPGMELITKLLPTHLDPTWVCDWLDKTTFDVSMLNWEHLLDARNIIYTCLSMFAIHGARTLEGYKQKDIAFTSQ